MMYDWRPFYLMLRLFLSTCLGNSILHGKLMGDTGRKQSGLGLFAFFFVFSPNIGLPKAGLQVYVSQTVEIMALSRCIAMCVSIK